MYIKAVEGDPFQLRHVYDEFRTQEMCIKAVEEAPRMLSHVPDNFKTQKMCKKAFEKKTRMLKYVPNIRHKECVKALLQKIYGHWCMSHDQ